MPEMVRNWSLRFLYWMKLGPKCYWPISNIPRKNLLVILIFAVPKAIKVKMNTRSFFLVECGQVCPGMPNMDLKWWVPNHLENLSLTFNNLFLLTRWVPMVSGAFMQTWSNKIAPFFIQKYFKKDLAYRFNFRHADRHLRKNKWDYLTWSGVIAK